MTTPEIPEVQDSDQREEFRFVELKAWTTIKDESHLPQVDIWAGTDEMEKWRDAFSNLDIHISWRRYKDKGDGEGFCIPSMVFEVEREGKHDLDYSAKGAIKIADYFSRNFGVSKESWRFVFSGGDSIHSWNECVLRAAKPMPASIAAEAMKEIAKWVSKVVKVKIDMGPYNQRGTFRLPNSLHPRTRLHSIPLTYIEVSSLTVEQIRELATAPRYPQFVDDSPNRNLTTLWKDKVELIQASMSFFGRERGDQYTALPDKSRPICITKIMGGVAEGTRHFAAIAVASWFFHMQKLEPEEVELRTKQWNGLNKPMLEPRELQQAIDDVLAGKVRGSCSNEAQKSFCKGKEKCWIPTGRQPPGLTEEVASTPPSEQSFVSVDDQKKADSMDLKAAIQQMRLLEDFKEPCSYVNQLLHAAHTYLVDLFDVTYYLGFFGPRGSGKSNMTANSIYLSKSGIMFTDATEAATAALLDECHTLGFDELDVLLAANKTTVLPSIIRSGYNRLTGARYLREKAGGEDSEWVTVKQNLFGPKVFNFMLSVDPATMGRTQLITTQCTEDIDIPRRSLFSHDYLLPVKLWLEKEVARCREGWTREKVKQLILSDEFGQELERCGPGLPRNREIGSIVLATAKIMKWDITDVLQSLFIGTTLPDEASVEYAIIEYLVGRWESNYPTEEKKDALTPIPISTIILVEKINDARKKQSLRPFGIKTVNAGLQALGLVKKGTDNRLPRGVFDDTNPPADPKKEGRIRGFYLPMEKVEAFRISLSLAVPGVPAVPRGGASSSGTGRQTLLSQPVPGGDESVLGQETEPAVPPSVPGSQSPVGTDGTDGTGGMRGIGEQISLALKLRAQGCTLEEISEKVTPTVIKHCQERGMLPIIEPIVDSEKSSSSEKRSATSTPTNTTNGKLTEIADKFLLEAAEHEEDRLKRSLGDSWPFVSDLIDDCAQGGTDKLKFYGASQIRAYAQRYKPTPSETIVEMIANDVEGYGKTLKLIARARIIKARTEAPQ